MHPVTITISSWSTTLPLTFVHSSVSIPYTSLYCTALLAATTREQCVIFRDRRRRRLAKSSTLKVSASVQSVPRSPSWSNQCDPENWQTVRGSFIAINAFVQSCRCVKAAKGPAPWAHLGDGCIDLVLIRACSRRQFLQFLLRISSSSHNVLKSSSSSSESPFDLPFVSVHRVCAFRFKGLAHQLGSAAEKMENLPDYRSQPSLEWLRHSVKTHPSDSIWCTDGETVHHSNVGV